MGAVALLLLIAAEASLGILAFGRTAAEQLSNYSELAAQLGLLAQLAYGLFPLLRRRRDGGA